MQTIILTTFALISAVLFFWLLVIIENERCPKCRRWHPGEDCEP